MASISKKDEAWSVLYEEVIKHWHLRHDGTDNDAVDKALAALKAHAAACVAEAREPLMEALGPFVEIAAAIGQAMGWGPEGRDDLHIWGVNDSVLVLGDFRRAAATYAAAKGEPAEEVQA